MNHRDIMSAGKAAELLELLALYASVYGKDCEPGITVLELAEDLAASLDGEYAPAAKLADWRDEVELGLAGKPKHESRLAERQRLYGLLPGEKPAS